MIKIIVENLSITGTKFDGEEPADFILLSNEEPYTITTPIRYNFTATLAINDVVVKANCNFKIAGKCGSCLKDVTEEININDIYLYFENPGQGELDISKDLSEEISLNLPINIVCDENCKGLCPRCGINLNTGNCDCSEKKEDLFSEEEDNIWGKLNELKLDNPKN
jgi:uncharacterized protein